MTARASRRNRRDLNRTVRLLALLVALVVALTSVLPVTRAEAQQRPKTVVEMLFGSGTRAEPPRRVIKKRVIRKKRDVRAQRATPRKKRTATRQNRSNPTRASAAKPARSAPAAAAAAADTSTAAPAKSENARTILVVGDFMAASLADGLMESFADDELVFVTSKANGSSGLVREDFYDWPNELGPIIDAVEPDILAVMIGANDRQPMRVSGNILAVRSDGWTAEYEKRATDLARIAEARKVPLIWVGMPSFKYDAMSEDMVFFNDIYKRAAERVSGEFVSIWDGFVDEKGSFIYSGPDVNGQTARLRGSDGLSLTDDGEDKLAFFTRKAVDRALGESPAQVALDDEALPSLQLQPLSNAANATVSAPIALNDPSFDGSDALLGTASQQNAFSLEMSPRDRLVLNGDPVNAREGRADNFAWNAKSDAIRSTPPVIYRGSIDVKTLKENSGLTPPKEMPTILDAIIEDWENSGADGAQSSGG
ncbi:SGNH family hydrolase [Fulvimarina sp. 2208YS6-2-32]|uniref:SGNH family hydrolase n=1 Tax=Fulvimarina uroteuthidis TaxID=3098149 RepID=A0ABU5HZD1_9HYPH|nr:SGNH family hydrolase [Fulvimarina sp. 2208YS6-2-32]MDY8108442.1 SGNH family hydrolase [Fulvimarina sp. 2208YS6-2-32]